MPGSRPVRGEKELVAMRLEDEGPPVPRHGFGSRTIGLFIRLVLGGVSLRGASRVLGLMAEALGLDWKIPHWTSGRLGLLRLGHNDVQLIALEPMRSSTKQRVHEQLEKAAALTGAPRVIVDDHGADLTGGVQLFQEKELLSKVVDDD